MTGEREWATGQPMTQARFTVSTFDGAFAPERIEQRQQRKAENGEIVAVDLLEQLNSKPLDLVSPNRAQHLFSGGGKVSADDLRRELTHDERRSLSIGPDGLALGRERNGAVQCVALAGEIEHLGGANDEGVLSKLTYRLSLGTGQHLGDVLRAQRARAADRLAHGVLVEAWPLDDEGEARRLQQTRSDLARRREYQRRPPALQEATHGSSTGAPRS